MAIPLSIYNERRVVMVRWKRARTGDPHRHYPDVDVRGTKTPEFAAIIGMMQDREAYVKMERENIDNAAPLFAVSSDAAKLQVLEPAGGTIPSGADTIIKLKALTGGNPTEVHLEIRFGSTTGPIVSRLLVRCYTRRRVTITPHVVTIHDGTGAGGTASVANVANIMTHVQAIWRHSGVEFTIGATQNETLNLATVDIVSHTPFPGELQTLLATNWVANTINVYFVRQIGTGNFLGFGFSRPTATGLGTNPGIILGDQTASGMIHDTAWAGNDLAHEAGHFFQLWHPNNQQPPNQREDTWSRRMLMHNHNLQGAHGNWKDNNSYGSVGGNARRGGLVTHKHITGIATDNETRTARGAIVSGPY
ncbi:MAG: hypothetical protein IPK82_16020 [Polyangiaceae bacterium]|nr:hypothetical protein [Polyangiaceae bacterium]